MENYKCHEKKITDNNIMRNKDKSRLNCGSFCYHSVQNCSYFPLMFKILKNQIYRALNLPVVLNACETWFLT